MNTFGRLMCALPFLGIAATTHALTVDLNLEPSSIMVDEDAGTVSLDVIATNILSGTFTASVDYTTTPGTATEGLDYTSSAGVLTFSEASLTQTIVIPITADNLVEDAEAFTVQLSNPLAGSSTPTITVDTSTVTIIDDDENATLSFAESSIFVTEDEGTILLAVNRTGNAGGAVSVTLTASGVTATLGDDYIPSPEPLVWADQELGVKFFPVTIVDDTEDEPDENFNVTLGSVTGAAEPGGITTLIATITDNDEPGAPVIQNLPQTVGEDVGTASVSVSRVGGSSGILEVTFSTSDITANGGEDYTAVSGGVLTWADGDTSDRTISIPIIDDGLVEDDESLRLSLTDPNDPNQPIFGDLTITDNDANAIVEFSDADVSVNETDGTVTLSVTRTGNSTGAVSVEINTLDGSAEAGSDYVVGSGALEWAEGETGERNIVVSILDDSSVEDEENFTVVLANPQGQADLGQNNPATVTIVSDDTPNPGAFIFADTPLSVDEAAGTATITLSRINGTDGELTVQFTIADGTATSPDDYAPVEVEVTWPDGEDTDRTVELFVIDDDIVEGDETLTLSLVDINDPSAGAVSEELTILDNDVDADAELAFFELSVNASEEDEVATVTVTRAGSSVGEVSVDVVARDGTASSPADYQLPSDNTITWLSGETGPRTIDIAIVDDTIEEEEETFSVSLANVTGPASLGAETTATVVIADNDPSTQGGPQFATITVATTEEAGIVTLTVLREGDASGPLTVDYATENGTASAPDDFTAVSGTLTWADGDETSRTIDIEILEDGLVEDDELFIVNLDNRTDPTEPRVTARVTIADNDMNAALEFVDLTVTTSEQGDAVTVTVTRSGNATGPVSVDFATEDGSATAPDDYAAAGGTLDWGDGELGERTITVAIVNDNVAEPEEEFTIILSNLTGQASLGANSAVTVVISESERPISTIPKLNPNQRQVANWFDRTCPRLTAMSDLTEEQQDLADICRSIRSIETTDEEVCNIIDEIMPNELFVSSFNALKLTAIQHGNLSQRINALRNGATGIDLAGLDIEINGEVIAGKQVEEFVSNLVGGAAGADGLNWGKWGGFIDGRLVTGEKDKGDLEEAFDFDIYGFTAGIDYRIKQNFIVGGAVGYGVVDSDFQGSGGGMDIESVTASAFLTYFNDSTYYLDAMATWGRNDYESKRNLNFRVAGIDVQRQAVGKTDGDQYSFGLGSGFDFSNGPLTYGPHAGVYYFNVASDSFTERGASGLELVVGDQRSESLTANLGGHISYAVNTDWGVFVPNARIDWVNEFKDNRETLSFSFLHDPFANDPNNPSPDIKIRTDRPDPSYFIWSVGVHTQLIYGVSGFIDYKSFSGYDNVTLQEVAWGLRWEKTW